MLMYTYINVAAGHIATHDSQGLRENRREVSG